MFHSQEKTLNLYQQRMNFIKVTYELYKSFFNN